MKRLFDVTVSATILLLTSPILLPVMFLVYWHDKHSPFYVAPRVGLNGKLFKMIKLRSMVINADRSGVDSTSAADKRITPVGQFVRRYKLDELTQMINVLRGEMSLVGPRPNVQRETDLYTVEERKMLSVKPGITDFSSIVFSDEGDILKDSLDPDIDYNQRIRPWKSRLALFYVAHRSLSVDFALVALTAISLFSRDFALTRIAKILEREGADPVLVTVAQRKIALKPFPPPGSTEIVMARA